MARLVLLSEGLAGRTYELKEEKTTVGRLPDNAFEIPETSVSSHHCEIYLRGGEVYVKDLDSTNGTFINGERITEGVLKPGQILRLGMVEMRLEDDGGSTAAAQPVTATPAAAAARKSQTRVIPPGVKLHELAGDQAPVSLEETGFEKKSNRATVMFIVGAVVVGVVLVGWLLYVALG